LSIYNELFKSLTENYKRLLIIYVKSNKTDEIIKALLLAIKEGSDLLKKYYQIVFKDTKSIYGLVALLNLIIKVRYFT